MPKYYVAMAEVWYRTVLVEAQDEKEAAEKAVKEDNVLEDQGMEYSHDLDRDAWQIGRYRSSDCK